MKHESPSPQSFDLAPFLTQRLSALVGALDDVAADAETLDLTTSLLIDQTIQLLRRGSAEELLDASTALHRFLERGRGMEWLADAPERHGAWTALARALSEGARKRNPAGVEAVLRSHRGKGRRVLELLALHEGSLPRAELRMLLDDLEESHLSHLLRDLEEADLVARFREEGAKEVTVELAWAGRDLVDAELLPRWAKFVAEQVRELRDGHLSRATQQELEAKLLELGMGSVPLAQLLARALANDLARSEPAERAREFIAQTARHYPSFDSSARQRPLSLFSIDSASRASSFPPPSA